MMNKKKFFLLMVFAFSLGCQAKDELPEDILSHQEMVQLLIDVRITEGKINAVTQFKRYEYELYSILEKEIFEKHKVDSSAYVRSHNYYLSHPELYLAITDEVIDSLKVRQSRLNGR